MQIEIRNIKKKFKSKEVLKGINLTVTGGKCIGILGTNGSGKSTLLSILAGIQGADSGDFIYEGNSLFKHSKERSKLIGYIPRALLL